MYDNNFTSRGTYFVNNMMLNYSISRIIFYTICIYYNSEALKMHVWKLIRSTNSTSSSDFQNNDFQKFIFFIYHIVHMYVKENTHILFLFNLNGYRHLSTYYQVVLASQVLAVIAAELITSHKML